MNLITKIRNYFYNKKQKKIEKQIQLEQERIKAFNEAKEKLIKIGREVGIETIFYDRHN